MKKAGRSLREILIRILLVASGLLALLMVCELYHPAFPDLWTASGSGVVVPELTALAPDSLLNSGSMADLDKLPGIGEVLAGRIIETRERDGLFRYPEDVMSVSGIGEKRFADIMAYMAAQEATPTDLDVP